MSKKKDQQEDSLVLHLGEGQILSRFDPAKDLDLNGSNLLSLAISNLQGEYRERVVGFVSGTMEQINTLMYNAEIIARQVTFLKRRLIAIQENKFRINRIGQVEFEEVELNG